jgi:hypothetical protein
VNDAAAPANAVGGTEPTVNIASLLDHRAGMVTTLPPLRVVTRVRCPRSRPKCPMSAPVASDTRSPLSPSSEIRACSPGGPSPRGDQDRPEFVAVQGGRMGFVVQPRAADVRRGRVLEELFFDAYL